MNDSIASADEYEGRAKTNLFNEIHTINTNNWQPEDVDFSLDRSQNQSLSGSKGNISFQADLPIKSKISEPLLDLEDVFLQEPQVSVVTTFGRGKQDVISEVMKEEDEKSQCPPSSISSNSLPSQVTITLYEQSICSKAYDEFETADASNFSISLRSFLSLNDKNYRPHVKCMKFLFTKLKDFSNRSLQNLKTYMNFMQVKMRQQIESLRRLDCLQEVSEDDPDFGQLNMDEKVILGRMKEKSLGRRQQRKLFYNAIKEEYKRLLQCWRKVKQRREARERHIDEQIVRVIDRIQLQMQDMIICRLQSQKDKIDGKFISQKVSSKNPYISKDKYLQMKYLIQRQRAYLKLITDFNGKVITYMLSMFSKQQVQITKNIKQAFLNYATAYMQCYDHSNQILTIKMDTLEDFNCEEQVKDQLVQVLLKMVPKELYNIHESKKDIRNAKKNRLEVILGDFSQSLQNTIFLSTIQMNNQFILFRSQAIWKTSSSILEQQESRLTGNGNQTKLESKQALAQSRPNTLQPMHNALRKENIKLIVVLTSNYYLHLENQDKIATLKLGDIKLSKKGREIIINSKEKGIGGYLGLKRQLGVLEFESTGEVDQFSHKLARALSKLNG